MFVGVFVLSIMEIIIVYTIFFVGFKRVEEKRDVGKGWFGNAVFYGE